MSSAEITQLLYDEILLAMPLDLINIITSYLTFLPLKSAYRIPCTSGEIEDAFLFGGYTLVFNTEKIEIYEKSQLLHTVKTDVSEVIKFSSHEWIANSRESHSLVYIDMNTFIPSAQTNHWWQTSKPSLDVKYFKINYPVITMRKICDNIIAIVSSDNTLDLNIILNTVKNHELHQIGIKHCASYPVAVDEKTWCYKKIFGGIVLCDRNMQDLQEIEQFDNPIKIGNFNNDLSMLVVDKPYSYAFIQPFKNTSNNCQLLPGGCLSINNDTFIYFDTETNNFVKLPMKAYIPDLVFAVIFEKIYNHRFLITREKTIVDTLEEPTKRVAYVIPFLDTLSKAKFDGSNLILINSYAGVEIFSYVNV